MPSLSILSTGEKPETIRQQLLEEYAGKPLRCIEEAPNYWISDNGEVFRLNRSGQPKKMKMHERWLGRTTVTPFYSLYMGGKKPLNRTVARLVATYWGDPAPERWENVTRIDGDPYNNHISNLTWDSRQVQDLLYVREVVQNTSVADASDICARLDRVIESIQNA